MNDPAKFNNVVSFVWAIADLFNGAFRKNRIIIPSNFDHQKNHIYF